MKVNYFLSISIIIVLLLSLICYSLIKDYILGIKIKKALEEAISNRKNLERELLTTIKENFLDSRGLLASEIKDNKPSDYSLLESMGELMEYAILTKSISLFESSWAITKRYFLSPRGYLYWRINRKTLTPDNSTSLLDSIRIVYSLVRGYEEFGKNSYLRDALFLGNGIIKFNTYEKYFVDFFDGKVESKSKRISTFYLDLEKISKISEYIPEFKYFYESSKEILDGAINESSVFFFPSYDITKKAYEKTLSVNIIEQTYIAMNIGKVDKIARFIEFIKYELQSSGKIYTSYNWYGEKTADSESVGSYVLLSIMFLHLENKDMLDILWDKIMRFKSNKNAFSAYDSRNFYIFDQLEMLIYLARREKTKYN